MTSDVFFGTGQTAPIITKLIFFDKNKSYWKNHGSFGIQISAALRSLSDFGLYLEVLKLRVTWKE